MLLRDDVVESDDIPEVQARIDLPRKRCDPGSERRGVARDAHSDHDRIELRRGSGAIDVRRLTPIGGERP